MNRCALLFIKLTAHRAPHINRKRPRITYTSFSDPGGNLTPMLTYAAQKKLPYNTLMGLARIAKDKKYYERAMKNYN